MAQGESEEEAKSNILDTLQAYFDTLIERAESLEWVPPAGKVLRKEEYKVKPEPVIA